MERLSAQASRTWGSETEKGSALEQTGETLTLRKWWLIEEAAEGCCSEKEAGCEGVKKGV